MDDCSPYGELLDKYFFTTATIYLTPSVIADITSMVDDTGDAELRELWDAYLRTRSLADSMAFWIAVWDGLWEALHGEGSSV